MEFSQNELLSLIIFGLIMIFVNKLFVNWYWEIPKRNRLLQAQTEFLAEIALLQGMPNDEIVKILRLKAPEIIQRKEEQKAMDFERRIRQEERANKAAE